MYKLALVGLFVLWIAQTATAESWELVFSENFANPEALDTNDVMAYIPSRRVLTEGGYEGRTLMIYYDLPTAWAPGIEETIVKEVRELVKPTN